MIKVIKGTDTSEETTRKVLDFINKIEPGVSINISSDLTCLDIPRNSVQIIWQDGRESILEGARK